MRSFSLSIGLIALGAFVLLSACSSCDSQSAPKAAAPTATRSDDLPIGEAQQAPPVLTGAIPFGASVLVDLKEKPEDGRFPLIHVWETVAPFKRACSIKPGVRGVVLGELVVKQARYYQVQTPQCTGYIKETLLTRTKAGN
jgi:hypothetical protein